jgi:hypothetical protein
MQGAPRPASNASAANVRELNVFLKCIGIALHGQAIDPIAKMKN